MRSITSSCSGWTCFSSSSSRDHETEGHGQFSHHPKRLRHIVSRSIANSGSQSGFQSSRDTSTARVVQYVRRNTPSIRQDARSVQDSRPALAEREQIIRAGNVHNDESSTICLCARFSPLSDCARRAALSKRGNGRCNQDHISHVSEQCRPGSPSAYRRHCFRLERPYNAQP